MIAVQASARIGYRWRMIDEALVARLSELANLELAPDERTRLTAELATIVAYVEILAEAELSGEPDEVAGATPLRADEPLPSLDRDRVLSQAPKHEAGGFAVPQFVDEG